MRPIRFLMNSVNQRLPAPSGAMVAMQNLRLRSPMALHGEGANSWIGPPLVGTSAMRLAGPSVTQRFPSAPVAMPRAWAPLVVSRPGRTYSATSDGLVGSMRLAVPIAVANQTLASGPLVTPSPGPPPAGSAYSAMLPPPAAAAGIASAGDEISTASVAVRRTRTRSLERCVENPFHPMATSPVPAVKHGRPSPTRRLPSSSRAVNHMCSSSPGGV